MPQNKLKNHPDFLGYAFRPDGTVWTFPDRVQVPVSREDSGTQYVRLKRNGRTKHYPLAQLILEVFKGFPPDKYRVIPGFREGKSCAADNLYWTFIRPVGDNEDRRLPLTEDQYFGVFELKYQGVSVKEIAKRLNMKSSTVNNIVHGKIVKNGPKPRVILVWPTVKNGPENGPVLEQKSVVKTTEKSGQKTAKNEALEEALQSSYQAGMTQAHLEKPEFITDRFINDFL